MKIFYISDARLPTEKAHGLAIMKQCEALVRQGIDVELVVPERRNHLTGNPFEYYKIKNKFPLKKLFTLDLIRFGYLGFLVQELTFAFAAARYLRGKKGIIYSRDDVILWILSLTGVRNYIWESHTGGWNVAARSVVRNAKHLVVISQGLKDFYAEHGVPSEKITVLPSAIDLEDFSHPEEKNAARARLGLSQNAKIAMYIGRLDGWKGSATLLEASKLLRPDLAIKLVIIGGDPAQVAALKADYPNVMFLGFRPYSELADNQAAADVLVVPNTGHDRISIRFTSPLKLIAHMAANRPIVASDLPSIREITADNTVFIARADDPLDLARAIEKVFEDPLRAESLAAAARAKVAAYTWDARAEKIIALCTVASQQ